MGVCPFCGFEKKEGDAHMVWFDSMPTGDINRQDTPTWGCGIQMDCIQPRPLGIVTRERMNWEVLDGK